MVAAHLATLALALALAAVALATVQWAHPAHAQPASAPTLPSDPGRCNLRGPATGGACAKNYTGICSSMVGSTVWLPNGLELEGLDVFVANLLATVGPLKAFIPERCMSIFIAFECFMTISPCTEVANAHGQLEAVPALPCRDFCTMAWLPGNCGDVFQLYYTSFVLRDNQPPQSSFMPFCGGLDGSFTQAPQPPDVVGGHRSFGPDFQLPFYPYYPAGLQGQLLFPNKTFNYTMSDGTVLSRQCQDPVVLGYEPNTQVASILPVCNAPAIITPDNLTCGLQCPFPIWSPEELTAIQWAYIMPGLVGFVLCLLVTGDVLLQIGVVRLLRRLLRRAWTAMTTASVSSSGAQDTTLSDENRRAVVRPTTIYALLGCALCIAYFGLGPAVTMRYGASVSCVDEHVILYSDLLAGSAQTSPTYCGAQRATPWVLQGVFNVILYSLWQVVRAVTRSSRGQLALERMDKPDKLMLAYCVLVPIVCAGVGLGLDRGSNDIFESAQQLMRSAAICTVRLSQAAEILLVVVPLLVTGVLISCLAAFAAYQLRMAQKALEGFGNSNVQSGSGTALKRLTFLLAVLGLATFAVVIVFLSATAAFQVQLNSFGDPFVQFFVCQASKDCAKTCADEEALFAQYRPTPTAVGILAASQSCVVLLFGGFFFAHGLSRHLARRQAQMAAAMTAQGAGKGSRIGVVGSPGIDSVGPKLAPAEVPASLTGSAADNAEGGGGAAGARVGKGVFRNNNNSNTA